MNGRLRTQIEGFFNRPLQDWRVLSLSVLLLASRIVAGSVFVYASLYKIMDPVCFAEDVKNYAMTPYGLLAPFALFLPWLELWTGLFLILGLWTRAAALLIEGMLAMFIVALGYAVYLDLNIKCGCFSADGAAVGWTRIWEDIGLSIAALLPLILGSGRFGLDALHRRSSRD